MKPALLRFIVVASVLLSVSLTHAELVSIEPVMDNEELLEYLVTVKGDREPVVGFNAEDIGWGTGTGVNELVAFAFEFGELEYVKTAELILELTPKGTGTDELLFADNASIRGKDVDGSKFYGNQELKTLPRNVQTSVCFDLGAVSYTNEQRVFQGYEDLTEYLLDGDLGIVYADDAIIHSAQLVMKCKFKKDHPPHAVPEGGTTGMLLMGIVMVGVLRSEGWGKRAAAQIW